MGSILVQCWYFLLDRVAVHIMARLFELGGLVGRSVAVVTARELAKVILPLLLLPQKQVLNH